MIYFNSTGVTFSDGSVQTVSHNIKSVQTAFISPKGSVAGDYGSFAVNIIISQVDPAKSFILYPAAVETSIYTSFRLLSAKFVNGSTIQFCCDTIYDTTPASIRFQVVEFQ